VPTSLRYSAAPAPFETADALVLCGPIARLTADDVLAALPEDARPLLPAMVASLKPGDGSASTATWIPGETPKKLSVIALSERASRHNSPGRPDLVGAALSGQSVRGLTSVILALADADHAFAAGCAAARAFPRYSRRSGTSGDERVVELSFLHPEGAVGDATLTRVSVAADAIRLAGELVDMPASELHTESFVARAQAIAAEVGAGCEVLDLEALRAGGFGGLVGVGQAATHPPALVRLSWAPEGVDEPPIVWVGKGIVYDTGGLSIKPKTGMPGMKRDMGGAAAVLGAFEAAARLGVRRRIEAILCLAENSVGPTATRPDDILTLYSGKRVEVNNTDAEGRLVLADGVAYAVKHLSPAAIVDVATLTGAQLIATGKRHAAIMSNDAGLEASAIAAGLRSGDIVYPIVYAPEFFREEFKSRVADLKNSVKNRMNAQSSCAGQFIAEHLGAWQGPWLHVDIAGPSEAKERGTGFGVALLLELLAG